MSVTSTGADFSARAARSPPNPPPMITTCFFMSGRLCALGDRLELREIRPPLVEEGVARLLRLRRTHARGELVHFEPAGLVEVLAQRALQQLLARSERVDRLLRELLRRLRRGLQDGLVRHDCGHQADPLRACGVEPRSKQEQLGGRATTHERGKPVARSHLRNEGQIDERRDEPGALARIDEIAMDEHRGSEAHRNPVHRRHDRLVETVQRGEQAHLRALAGAGRVLHEILEIVAGGEGVSRAVDKHDARCIVLRRRLESFGERHVHGGGDRVLLPRSVELHLEDASGSLGEDLVHRPPPAAAFAGRDACGIVPLARKPSICFASNPSCSRISSLCSPSSGARLAGTLATPCTWIGLLIVEVSLPPAPCSGTTMSFARSCGSSITSSGPRTAPNVTWTPLKTSYQCAIGCAPKTSSRIAENWGMLAISFAGSEKRGSVMRSGRPIAFATAASLSEVTRSTNQMPSAVRYTFI